jgi:hypothetical protein
MLLITDALLNTGDINPDTVSQIGKAYEESGIRLTGVGVGRDFNDAFLNKLTEKGHGSYVYLGSEAVVDRIFGDGFLSLTQTLAHDVQFALDLPDSLAMSRFYGEEASTQASDIQPIDYQAGTSQLFLQDLKIREHQPTDPLKLTIRWKDPVSGADRSQVWSGTLGEMLGANAKNVWKGRALMAWADMAQLRASQQTACTAEAHQRWEKATEQVGGDSEIKWLQLLTNKICGPEGSWNHPPASPEFGFYGSPQVNTSQVRVGNLAMVGNSDPKIVGAVLKRFRPQIQYCYEREVLKDPSIAGDLTEKFVIGMDGSVVSATVESSTLHNSSVESCVNSRFLHMQFPPSPHGVVVVKAPYTFTP